MNRMIDNKRTFCLFTVAIVSISLILLTFTACENSPSLNIFLKNGDETKDIKSNEIYIPSTVISTLNPVTMTEEDGYYISKLIYSGLFRLDDTMRPVPDLVENIVGYEENVLELELKRGIMWHDGSELVADDVKYSIAQHKWAGGKGIGLFGEYVADIKKVGLDKNDPYKLYLHYNKRQDMLKAKLTFPIIQANSMNSGKGRKKASFKPIGTGQYKVADHQSGRFLRLEPNEHYYDGSAVNIIIFKMFPDKAYAKNLIDSNALSVFFNMDTQDIIAMGDTEYQTVRFPSNKVEFIGFNCSNPVLIQKKVRQAIAYAVDTEELCESAYYSAAKPIDTLYYPNFWGIENMGDAYPHSQKQAMKLLDRAGFAEIHGIMEDGERNQLKLQLIYNEDNESRAVAADMIAERLKEIKIVCEPVPLPYSEYISRIASGNYDIYLGGGAFADYYDLRRFLSSKENSFNYKNYMLDRRLDKMCGELDDAEFVRNYKFAKKILTTDVPCYPILYKEYEMVYPDSLKAEPAPIFNNLYNNCAEWKHVYHVKIESKTEKKQ